MKYYLMVRHSLLALIPIVLAMILIELAVHLVFPEWAPGTPGLAQFWHFDKDYGWSHVPGARGRFRAYGFDTLVEINSQGFRGPEIPEIKDPSKKRIIVVGDSYVWGFGVNQNEIFTSQMQAICQNLDVINLGVSGYSTDQELLVFKEKGIMFKPDIVILVVATNDFASNTRSTEYVYFHKPLFLIQGDRLVLSNWPVPKASFLVRAAASLARQSYILTQVGRVIQGLRTVPEGNRRAEAVDIQATRSSGQFPRTHAERVTAMLIAEFRNAVRGVEGKFLLAFSDQQGPRGRALVEFLKLDSVPVVHIDDFMHPSDHERLHLKDGIHWSPAGHEIVARSLLHALEQSGTLGTEVCPTSF